MFDSRLMISRGLLQASDLHHSANTLAQLPMRPRPARAVDETEKLVDVYQRFFGVLSATSDELLQQAYSVRYQVYCVERKFEDPAENVDGLEIDEFDSHAVHSVLLHRPSGAAAGTVRLILPVPGALDRCFPIQNVCDDARLKDPNAFPLGAVAEASRFCVSKDFRRRLGDGHYGRVEGDSLGEAKPWRKDEQRVIPYMMLGLFEGLIRMSVENGIVCWFAVMEPQLLRLLTRVGIHFDPIGSMVDYHGKRQPCYRYLPEFLTQVREEREDVWEIITNRGEHWEALCAIESQRR